MSFASRWLLLLVLESRSVLCIHLFSTLIFAVAPWVSGEVVEGRGRALMGANGVYV